MSNSVHDLGIKAIDSLLKGGIPSGSILTLTGPGGEGKGLVALRFLARGFEKGQVGLYVSFTSIPLSAIVRDISGRRSLKSLLETEEPMLLSTHDLSGLELVQGILKEGTITRLVLDRPEVLGLRNVDGWFRKLEDILRKAREMKVSTILIEGDGAKGMGEYLTEGTIMVQRNGNRNRAELTRWAFAPLGWAEEREEAEWIP